MRQKERKKHMILYILSTSFAIFVHFCCGQLIRYILILSGFYLYLTAFHYLISIPKSALMHTFVCF